MVPDPQQLPRPSTSFVGRSTDVRTLCDLLGRHALVTLAGPGGAGKTRLAIESATRLATGRQGVRWVELAALSDEAAVPLAVARAVGALVDPGRDPTTSVTAHLGDRRSLLCLDNAEHMVRPVAALVDAVLGSCPHVTVLVTSREPLGLAGEVVWRVPPLPDDEAEGLFIQRAAAVRPGYEPDARDSEAIKGIVGHLDGIPLALELAAAWSGTLSATQVLAGLDDRFRLLVRGPRNAQRRHQTLAASIGWSHALLDEPERAFFRRLSAFAGPFSLEAALQVAEGPPVTAGAGVHALASLVDKSLVMANHSEGDPRYRMLETIRAFAAARMAEAREDESVRQRHLRYYIDLAESAGHAHGEAPERWRGLLQREYVDLRAALDRALGMADTEPARRLAASLAWMWHGDRSGPEGLGYLRRAIDLEPDDRSVIQARLLTGLALVADTAAPLDLEYDAAVRALEVSTEVGDAQLRGLCLNLAAVGASYTDFDRACELADEAIATAPCDPFTRAAATTLRSIVHHHRDQHDSAGDGFEEVVPHLLRLHRGIASTALSFQALGELVSGQPQRARQRAEEAVRVADPLGDHLRVGIARSALAVVHARGGRHDDATAALEPLLRVLAASPDEVFVPGLAHVLGVLAAGRGDAASAVEWLRRDAAATDRGLDSWIAASSLADLGRVLVGLGDVAEATSVLDRAVTSATRLGMPRVLAVATAAQAELAALAPGSIETAIELDHVALAIRADHGLKADLPDSLEDVARHGAASRPSADDVRLGAAAEAARGRLGVPRPAGEEARWSSAVTDLRTRLGDEAFAVAWSEGARLTLDEAVRYARRARGGRGRPSSGWASLTPTELEVTALVAEGLNNPEIAARLLMGRGTVKTHLAHIFSKVGVKNRTELASMAIVRGKGLEPSGR